ncbi:MAG: NUDIX hydrolase [Marinilabiliales bacterium]|nr:MAG: NUDIX hydrolase [Marinilabiliales bacterium]
MISDINRYIIRVYALIFNSNKDVLISDEYQLDMRMTKFPGGGMEFGEGPVDCLKREAVEEFGQKIKVLDHFYTTDYFQPTQFFPDAQLISIYYFAEFISPIQFKISNNPFNFEVERNGSQSFRWKNLSQLQPNDMTFPVDKKVVQLLKERYGND